ncbi:MAG: hypothetical protein ACFFDB_00390 [Promethearchaeota archaeon]
MFIISIYEKIRDAANKIREDFKKDNRFIEQFSMIVKNIFNNYIEKWSNYPEFKEAMNRAILKNLIALDSKFG